MAQLLEYFLKRHAVDHSGQHAHVIGSGLSDVPLLGQGGAANDIAPSNHHSQLRVKLGRSGDLAGDQLQFSPINSVTAGLAERLPADFQYYTLIGFPTAA